MELGNKLADKSGTNIVNKIDFQLLAKDFVNFFYSNWMTNNQIIKTIINLDSRISYQKKIYKGYTEVLEFLSLLSTPGIIFEIIDFNAMESGSRRIDIVVNGFVQQSNGVKYRLAQYFLIAHQNDSWKLQNSILNIFI
jgi:hypothetical protein